MVPYAINTAASRHGCPKAMSFAGPVGIDWIATLWVYVLLGSGFANTNILPSPEMSIRVGTYEFRVPQEKESRSTTCTAAQTALLDERCVEKTTPIVCDDAVWL